MTDNLSLDLNDTEREVLLRGLRCVRSSISMHPCDPSPDVDARRQEELQQVLALADRLQTPSASPTNPR